MKFQAILLASILITSSLVLSNEVFAQSQLEDRGKLELASLQFKQFGKSTEKFVVDKNVKIT